MDQEVVPLWKEIIRVRRWARHEKFLRDVDHLREVAGGSGRLNSGFYVADLDERAVTELTAREEEWWATCTIVLEAGKVFIDDDSSRDLEHVFAGEILDDHQKILAALSAAIPRGHLVTPGFGLESTKARAKATFRNHLALLRLSQKASELPLSELLKAPRYTAVRQHWEKANELVATDPSGALREAVSAVEAGGKLLVKRPAATLSDVLKELKKSSRLAPLLTESIEKVWGYASATVRHGTPVAPAMVFAEARFCVDASGAALRWILTADRPV